MNSHVHDGILREHAATVKARPSDTRMRRRAISCTVTAISVVLDVPVMTLLHEVDRPKSRAALAARPVGASPSAAARSGLRAHRRQGDAPRPDDTGRGHRAVVERHGYEGSRQRWGVVRLNAQCSISCGSTEVTGVPHLRCCITCCIACGCAALDLLSVTCFSATSGHPRSAAD
jgi:hypothetical protein